MRYFFDITEQPEDLKTPIEDIMELLSGSDDWPPDPSFSDISEHHRSMQTDIDTSRSRRSRLDNAGSILALDLGTSTGWALRRNDGVVASGPASFKPHRYEGSGMRYLRFAQWLDRLDLPDVVYFEEVRRHQGVDAAHCYGGLLATLTAWCEARQIPYAGTPVGTIKVHATGKGNASKAAMIEAAWARGFSPCDDNEADAIAILHVVLGDASIWAPPRSSRVGFARPNVVT